MLLRRLYTGRQLPFIRHLAIVFAIAAFVLAGNGIALAEVKVETGEIGTRVPEGGKVAYKRIEIPYGSGKDEVAVYSEGEGAFGGPNSFALDKKGNIYVLDTVNERVQVYSEKGAHLRTIHLGKALLLDMVIDEAGNLYVLQPQGFLYQFDKKGNLMGETRLNEDRWGGDSGSRLLLLDDTIYVGTFKHKAAAKIEKGKLKKLTNEELRKELPWHQHSGKEYRGTGATGSNKIMVNEPDGSSKIIELSYPYEGRYTPVITYGDDKKGNLYGNVQLPDQSFEIVVHSPEGKAIKVFSQFTLQGYYGGTVRPRILMDSGTLYILNQLKEMLTIDIYYIGR